MPRSHLARERFMLKCLAPEASAVMKGRLMSVCCAELSSHLAFSAASRSLWIASLSLLRSMPYRQAVGDKLPDAVIYCWQSDSNQSVCSAMSSRYPPVAAEPAPFMLPRCITDVHMALHQSAPDTMLSQPRPSLCWHPQT